MTRIVYLHGLASGPDSKKARMFRERFRERGIEIAVPDLAAGDFEHLTVGGQLEVIAREAAGGPVSLVGSSLGGYLAALYAARHAEVRRLVLMAPAFCLARRWAEWLGREKMEEWRRRGWLPIYHYSLGREARVGYELYDEGLRYEDYPEVRQPTLIFHGTRDEAVPPAVSEEFRRRSPAVTLRLVDSDHELLSAADEIWREAERFLIESEER